MDLLDDIRKNYEIQSRTCFICDKIFSGRSQLNRHLKEVHNTPEKVYNKNPRNTFKCLEGCGFTFRTNRDLRCHLNDSHGFNITVKTIEFDNFEDFQKWFVELQETSARFVKNQGSKSKRKQFLRITYYSCNRSGRQKYKPTDGKPRLKTDYRKINAGCTSFLKLVEMSGKCLVTYCDFHYGHKMELEHLPLSFRSRAKIVDMLENGAQIVKIKLDEGGSYIGLNNMQRWKILTSSDLKSLKYYTKKELKTMPTLGLRNINVIEPDEESSTTENESVEVITIISSNSDSEVARKEEEIIYNGNNEIRQSFQEDVDAMGSNESEELLADVHFGDETGVGHAENTDEYVEISTDEDMYGRYVAEELKKMEPCKRVLAKEQIDKIIQTFPNEKYT